MKVNKSVNDRKLRYIGIKAYNRQSFGMIFSIMLSALFSSVASATEITAGMNMEVVSEFNKQLSATTYPEMSNKLIFMENPYGKSLTIINNKISDKSEKNFHEQYQRRLMTHDESIIEAKSSRFDACQTEVVRFIAFAKHSAIFSSGKDALTKDKIMKDNGVEYPFTVEEKNDGDLRPIQISLELGWQYKGQGEGNVEAFFKACLAIPIDLYYWEDSFE